MAPALLLRVAGVPPALLGRVTPPMRRHLVDGFLPARDRRDRLAYNLRQTVPNAPDLPIERLRMPVLLVGVADDPYWTAEVVESSAPRIPDATSVVLESGGHVMVGHEDRLQQEVRPFLGTHLTAGRQASEGVMPSPREAADRPPPPVVPTNRTWSAKEATFFSQPSSSGPLSFVT